MRSAAARQIAAARRAPSVAVPCRGAVAAGGGASARAVAVAAAAAAGAAATGLLCFRPPPAQAQKSGGSRIRTAAATAGSASAAVAAASGGAKISSAAAAAAGKAQPNALGILGLSEEGDGGIGVLPLSPLHQQLAVNLMAVLDQNHDGKLTFREVLKLTEMTEPHWSDGRRLAKGERLLDQMDADRDGFVSKQEFLRYIERQYETFDERRHLFSVMVALDQLHQFVNGTRDDRNATTIVQQLEIGHISSLVNAVVDLPFFNEDQEQEIFEDAVVQVLQILDSALPHPYKQLIVSEGHDCSLPGLPEDEAEPLKLRLENHIERSLSLVCMEEPIERMLRTAVVEIVVEAMKTGNSLKDVTNAYRSGQLIMNIFIRGSVAMLRIGSSQRGQVVDTVTSNITLPFLPAFITQHCVEFLLGRVEVIVETGINNVFNRHFNAAKQQMQHCQQLEHQNCRWALTIHRSSCAADTLAAEQAPQSPEASGGNSEDGADPQGAEPVLLAKDTTVMIDGLRGALNTIVASDRSKATTLRRDATSYGTANQLRARPQRTLPRPSPSTCEPRTSLSARSTSSVASTCAGRSAIPGGPAPASTSRPMPSRN